MNKEKFFPPETCILSKKVDNKHLRRDKNGSKMQVLGSLGRLMQLAEPGWWKREDMVKENLSHLRAETHK